MRGSKRTKTCSSVSRFNTSNRINSDKATANTLTNYQNRRFSARKSRNSQCSSASKQTRFEISKTDSQNQKKRADRISSSFKHFTRRRTTRDKSQNSKTHCEGKPQKPLNGKPVSSISKLPRREKSMHSWNHSRVKSGTPPPPSACRTTTIDSKRTHVITALIKRND